MATLEAGIEEKRSTKRRALPRRWTAEEFLDWLQPKVRADLIGGRRFLRYPANKFAYMHSPAHIHHGNLVNTVGVLLGLYAQEKELGEVHREVIALRLDGEHVFLPDLMYFTKEQAARLRPEYAQFAPTLIVEALSKTTAHRDTGLKYAAYERHKVQEYWILDPLQGEHQFHALENGRFVEFAKRGAKIESRTVPGFYLLRRWLNPAQPLRLMDCLREILGGTL